ncbi:MAG: hypothetical protein QW416_04495 [Candidatus Nitrosocaldaceae archaeon]
MEFHTDAIYKKRETHVHSFIRNIDGEMVCDSCGYVLGYTYNEELKMTNNPRLFHVVELGGKEQFKRLHINEYTSSDFSIVCEKLNLPLYAALDAWSYYSRLLKSSSRIKKAEAALLSISNTCIRYAIPKSEYEIKEVIKSVYVVNKLPSLLKIMNKLSDICNISYNDEYFTKILINELNNYVETCDKYLMMKAIKMYNMLKGRRSTRMQRSLKLLINIKRVDKEWRRSE